MNFKEALIAHLQGEKVEVQQFTHWEPLMHWIARGNASLCGALSDAGFATACEFRLAPRTIRVNGVEVPAPEKDAPALGARYYLVEIDSEKYFAELEWAGTTSENTWLERGLVYLTKEDAIARAKAMLLTQE